MRTQTLVVEDDPYGELRFEGIGHDYDGRPALQDIDAYVESVRDAFDVPGIAVAVVKDGELVLAKGWGEREMGRAARVDAHTMFAIASNTKAFTSASISVAVSSDIALALPMLRPKNTSPSSSA